MKTHYQPYQPTYLYKDASEKSLVIISIFIIWVGLELLKKNWMMGLFSHLTTTNTTFNYQLEKSSMLILYMLTIKIGRVPIKLTNILSLLELI